jgi:hypothetical protein
MLYTAPLTLPYSAGAPSDRISTSWIASRLGAASALPKKLSVISVPSSWNRFSS